MLTVGTFTRNVLPCLESGDRSRLRTQLNGKKNPFLLTGGRE